MPSPSKSRSIDRTSAELGIYVITLLHLLLIEVVLAGISFFVVLDVFFVDPTTMMVLELAAFLVSLILWIIIITCFKKYFIAKPGDAERGSVYIEERGGALFSSASVYFFVVTVMHAVFSLAFIIWVVDYGDLSPLNFVTNSGPFIIARDVFSWQFIALFIALFFFIYDIRHQRQLATARETSRTLAAISASSNASDGTTSH